MLKQIKKLTALLFVAATMFTFDSCNKDNNDDNPQPDNTIIGTTWTHVESGDWFDEENDTIRYYSETEYIRFTTETTGQIGNSFVVEGLPEESSEESYPFSYTYNYPNGTISIDELFGEFGMATFTINGDRLTLNLNDDYYPIVFIKQQ